MARNLLFITADQMRADCLSLLGHPCVRTPNLDRLASEGVLFANHFTNAAPCGPARACLHTGSYLNRHGLAANEMRIGSDLPLLANSARGLGYDPVLFGYTDVGIEGQEDKMLAGFREGSLLNDDYTVWRRFLKDQGHVVSDKWASVFVNHGDDLTGPSIFPAEHSLTAFQTEGFLAYLDAQGDAPWFAHLSYAAPHPPFVVPEPYDKLYAPAAVPGPKRAAGPEDEAAVHPYLAYLLQAPQGWPNRVNLPNENLSALSDAQVKAVRSAYFAMITEMDDHIGRILDRLAEWGALAHTLILFTSDHGEMLGDHWLWAKYAFFEPAFHVPLIIRAPETTSLSPAQRQVSHFTEHVDVMPTLLNWLDPDQRLGPHPKTCKGQTLLPFLRGRRPADWRTSAFSELDFRSLAPENTIVRDYGLTVEQARFAVLRDSRYKLVHFPAFEPLFFDLKEDPEETQNLVHNPDFGDLIADYTTALKRRYTH